jgi:hypothetical protein
MSQGLAGPGAHIKNPTLMTLGTDDPKSRPPIYPEFTPNLPMS